jgi:hypothetical protein
MTAERFNESDRSSFNPLLEGRRGRPSISARRPTFPERRCRWGWLIFGLPPSEVAIHPGDQGDEQEFYLMVDDAEAFVAEMKSHGRTTAPLNTQPYGITTSVTLPSGHELGVYQPTHERP